MTILFIIFLLVLIVPGFIEFVSDCREALKEPDKQKW